MMESRSIKGVRKIWSACEVLEVCGDRYSMTTLLRWLIIIKVRTIVQQPSTLQRTWNLEVKVFQTVHSSFSCVAFRTNTMRHFGSAKKQAKATDDVLKSQVYQAIKTVSKTVKIVKTFLVLKCNKKISSLRESLSTNETNASSIETRIAAELESLETLKSLDHSAIAGVIVRLKVAFGNDTRYNPVDKEVDSKINSSLLKTIMHHKRIEETIAEIQAKIQTTIEKNNELRAKEQSKASTQKAKSIFSKKDGVYVDGTKAVFMESLDNSAEVAAKKKVDNRDLVKLNKSLRNQANRMANRAKKATETGNEESSGAQQLEEEYDNSYDNSDPSLSMYRPLDQRFPAPANTGKGKGTNKSAARSSSAPAAGRQSERLKFAGPGGASRGTGHRGDQHSAPAPMRARKPPAPVIPVMQAAELTQAASFGKDWKKTGVHPSWAAKQHTKQQTVGTIPSVSAGAAGQGKKIVFED